MGDLEAGYAAEESQVTDMHPPMFAHAIAFQQGRLAERVPEVERSLSGGSEPGDSGDSTTAWNARLSSTASLSLPTLLLQPSGAWEDAGSPAVLGECSGRSRRTRGDPVDAARSCRSARSGARSARSRGSRFECEPNVEPLPTEPSSGSFMDDLRFGVAKGMATSNATATLRALMGRGASPKSWWTGEAAAQRQPSSPVTAEAVVALAATPRPLKPMVQEAREPRFGASFPISIIGTILMAASLSCFMYVPLEQSGNDIRTNCVDSCRNQTLQQRSLITDLVTRDVTPAAFDQLLDSIVDMVHDYVQVPPDEAIDSLWTTMRAQHHINPAASPSDARARQALAYQAYLSLAQQWFSDRSSRIDASVAVEEELDISWTRPHAEQLYVGFENGAFAGMRLRTTCFGKNPYMPDLENSSEMACAKEYMDCAGRGSTARLIWEVDEATGDREGLPQVDPPDFDVVRRPWYRVQSNILEEARRSGDPASVRAKRAWSSLYYFGNDIIGISWTAPVAFCGDYSCLEGVMGSDIELKKITNDCTRHWQKLREILERSQMIIHEDNSSLFLVNSMSRRNRTQEGLLVGASNNFEAMDGTLTLANESGQAIVKGTARALLERFGSWDRPELRQRQNMTFRGSRILRDPPELVSCEDESLDLASHGDCYQVGSQAIQLDEETRWLIVSVLPLGAFGKQAAETAAEIDQVLDGIMDEGRDFSMKSRTIGASAFLLVAILSIGLGYSLYRHVSVPLQRLSMLMQRLQNLDFARDTQAFKELSTGQTCRVRDVGKLERAFCRISRSIEAFSRFVPEPVVRNIVRGDQRATRLHVSKRQVTIMFTSIRDFGAIAEGLREKDVLFILTRYFSLMTQIVEFYDGVIAEILTDGLLVFWNTPQVVENHACKACSAALAQQRAMLMLNSEVARMGLPKLSIRIGLHTGDTLSGNIGSDLKMKFGCLGDPVNLTSRLEGLCTYYGVGIVCSAATHEALPLGAGFHCRRLDLVQVKGKRKPITIYQVIKRTCHQDRWGRQESCDSAHELERQDRVRRYEEALAAFQQADFEKAREITTALHDEDANDKAVMHLRDRASGHIEEGLTDEELQHWTGVLSMLVKH